MSGALMTITRSQSGQFDIGLTPEAAQMKEDVLGMLATINRVETAEDQELAVLAMRDAKALLAQVEKAREEAKKPFWDAGKRIDAAAKAFSESLNRELMRCSVLTGNFAELQLAKQRAEEAARKLEEQRIERERQAEILRVQAEEMRKRQELAEAERKAREAALAANSKAQREEAFRLAAEAQRQRDLAEAESAAKMDKINAEFCAKSELLPVVERPAVADGQTIKEEPVIDEIRELELMRARPDLVRRVEFDRVAIKAELERGIKVPGVKWHMQTKTVIRAATHPQAIEIGGRR